MAKKSRTILSYSVEEEINIYKACDDVGIKGKHISTFEQTPGICRINVYCSKKKFNKLMNKADLCKITGCYW